jgi:hypothetical protein
MIDPKLPHYKSKQQILFAKDAKPETLSDYGRRYLAVGWLSDALEFFTRAGDQRGLEEIRARSIQEGDVFIFRRVLDAQAQTATDAEWKQVAENARQLGKLQFAREAFRMAQDRKSLDEIEHLINPPAETESAPASPPEGSDQENL